MGMSNIIGTRGHHILRFVAVIERFGDTAMVRIYPRKGRYDIDFTNAIEDYETLNRGAAASARRSIRKLEKANPVESVA